MHKSLLVITLLTAAAIAASAQTTARNDSSEQAIMQVTQAWLDADERQDRAALDKIIADDFLGTAPGGRMVNKADIVPREGTSGGHSLSISTADVKVRLLGDTAVVIGRGIPKTPERAAHGELRFTVVFAKRDNRWQLVAAHLSPIPKE